MTRKRLCIALWIVAFAICGFQGQNFPASGLGSAQVLSWGTDTGLSRFGAGAIGVGNGTAADISGDLIAANHRSNTGTVALRGAIGATLGNAMVLAFSSTASEGGTKDTAISRDAAGIVDIGTGAASSTAGTLKAASLIPNASAITAGADGTVINVGEVRRVVYKITVSGTTCTSAGGFIAAALNADCVIATFPAKTEIVRILVDNTAGFTCSSVCTGTKTVQVGKTSGGTEFLLAKDATVVATYGLVNGDLGASLATSATTPVGGGDLPSWTATTTIRARYVSGTGNWGNGAATTVNAGSTTFYIETLVFP